MLLAARGCLLCIVVLSCHPAPSTRPPAPLQGAFAAVRSHAWNLRAAGASYWEGDRADALATLKEANDA